MQSWLWAAPLKQSTVQITQFFDKVDHLRTMGVADHWPATVNDAAVRHYARRCAHRAQADHPLIQALEVLRKTYAARATSLATTPTIKLGNRWQKIIAGADRQKALAAF